MRTKQIIPGLKNSQRIRVILNGIGFTTTVQGMSEMPFTEQRVTVWCALETIVREDIRGIAATARNYNSKMELITIDFQVDLL